MRNFSKVLFHSLIVLLFVIVMLFLSTLPYFCGETYYYQDNKVRKQLAGKIDTIAIGSSHALRSIKPTILNKKLNIKAYNLSSPLMSMFGRYTLLKKEISRNQIKTLIFEISYNALTLDKETLGYEGDLYVLGRLDNYLERIKFVKGAFSPSEYIKVLSDTLDRSRNSLKKHNTELEQYKTYGYLPVMSNDKSLSSNDKRKILNTQSLDVEIRKDNLKYLDKIMKLCKKNNIRVILVVTPVTEEMILTYDNMDELFSKYVDLAKKYECEYYDFNLDKKRAQLYSEKTSFFDVTHMSDEGADIFTNRLGEIINKVNLNENVTKEFYHSYDTLKKTILKQ